MNLEKENQEGRRLSKKRGEQRATSARRGHEPSQGHSMPGGHDLLEPSERLGVHRVKCASQKHHSEAGSQSTHPFLQAETPVLPGCLSLWRSHPDV